MSSSKKLCNAHAKAYIQEVFAERLISEGFRCPDDKLLCWYRIKNEDIVDSVIFYSHYSNLPLLLWIGYGIFPSFQKPFFLSNVVCVKHPRGEEHFCDQPILGALPYKKMQFRSFSEDILVYAPDTEEKGGYTLDELLLPAMNEINTLCEVYEYHKSRLRKMSWAKDFGAFSQISKTFITMAYILEDTEMYPFCKSRISEMAMLFEQLNAQFPTRQQYQEELHAWRELDDVFRFDNRMEFLAALENRKNKNLRSLKKKININ